MRGLIIKDLLFLKSSWKNLIVIFIGSLMLSIALGNYLLSIIVLPIMLLTSGISTFQTDEFYNTESYTLSYPLTRKQIVLSKFIFTLVMLIISTYIGLIIYTLIYFIINPGYNGLNTSMIKELLMLEAASLIVDAIFYPIIYKYGCEKSRFVLMSIVMVLIGVFALLSIYINVFDNVINFESIILFIENYGLQVLSVVVVILVFISYWLSNLFYKHKDF